MNVSTNQNLQTLKYIFFVHIIREFAILSRLKRETNTEFHHYKNWEKKETKRVELPQTFEKLQQNS